MHIRLVGFTCFYGAIALEILIAWFLKLRKQPAHRKMSVPQAANDNVFVVQSQRKRR
jgi:hypothetical protein